MRTLIPLAALFLGLALTPFAETAESVAAIIDRLGGTFERGPGGASAPIVKVDLHGSAVTDADLAFLSSLPSLETLDLRLTKVSDAGMKHVGGLTRLQFLNLFRTGLTDMGLSRLSGLTGLETLLVGGTAITDDGLASLKAFPKLRKLSLFDTRITDAGLKHLWGRSNLKVLLVAKSQVTEAGKAEIQKHIPGVRFQDAASPIQAALFQIEGESFVPPQNNAALQALLAKKPVLSFSEACGVGDAAEVARRVKHDPKLATSWNDFGWTALHLAAFSGSAETVRILLDAGADVHLRAKTQFRNTPLQAALLPGQYETARLLLARGADANVRQAKGFTPLQEAALLGRRDLVDLLLENGADVNSRADDGRNAVTEALRGKHPELAEYLKSKGGRAAEITANVMKAPE